MPKTTTAAVALLTIASVTWSALANDAGKDVKSQPDKSKELFSRLDANGDGQLSSDEIPDDKKQLLERLLRTADKNKDGKLSAEEFVAGTTSKRPKRPLEQKRPAEQPGAETVRRLIRQLDTNSDGTIVADEVSPQYREMFNKLVTVADTDKNGKIDRRELMRSAPKLGTILAQARKKMQNPVRMFERLDANKDGKVVLDEVPEQARERFERLMARADKNKDGALTKEELTAAVKAFQRPATTQRPQMMIVGGVFSSLDTNKDGELSADEISAASASLAKLDKNSDGKISREELRPRGARPQAAVGSRADPKQLLQRFLQMDKDKDGKISKDEAPERFRAQFDRIDVNSDGQIDEAELKKHVERIIKRFKAGAKTDARTKVKGKSKSSS